VSSFIKRRIEISGFLSLLISLIFLSVGLIYPEGKKITPVVLLGRVESIDYSAPKCGILHNGSPVHYTDVTTLSGGFSEEEVVVVHGCTELTREEYIKGSGSLKEFKKGDYHKITISRDNIYDIEHIFDAIIALKNRDYYFAVTVDLADAP